MNPKRPNIPVAVPNDDGSSTIVGSEELRARREQHETKITHDRDGASLIARYRAGTRPSTIELLQHLAIALLHHADDRPESLYAELPVGLIEPIAIAISDMRTWSKVKNAERRKDAAKRQASWDAKAAALVARDPSLRGKYYTIAQRICRPGVHGESARSIRRYFEKRR